MFVYCLIVKTNIVNIEIAVSRWGGRKEYKAGDTVITALQPTTFNFMKKELTLKIGPSIATINSDAKTYRDLSGPGFRKLAGYIFGGNEANAKISMTSPVNPPFQFIGRRNEIIVAVDWKE